jgi:N-acyl-D-aspartate/D-glutamate deacylase
MLEVARLSGCRLHISHLKATGRGSRKRMERALELVDEALEGDVDVTFDVYPYAAGSTALAPALRADENRERGARSNVQLASVPGEPELSGRWLADVADERGTSVEQSAAQILIDSPDASAIIHMMDPESVRLAISHDRCFIGSDGLPDPSGRTHPRHYGTFPRVIQQYCLPGGGLALESVVRRMTALPAERFAIPNRGTISPGGIADLVLFDPTRIADTGTFARPAQRPRGIETVLLAGRVVVTGGAAHGAGRGRVL